MDLRELLTEFAEARVFVISDCVCMVFLSALLAKCEESIRSRLGRARQDEL